MSITKLNNYLNKIPYKLNHWLRIFIIILFFFAIILLSINYKKQIIYLLEKITQQNHNNLNSSTTNEAIRENSVADRSSLLSTNSQKPDRGLTFISSEQVDLKNNQQQEKNHKLLMLSINLLISAREGENLIQILEEIEKNSKIGLINNKIQLIKSIAAINISKLSLFNELINLEQDIIKSSTVNYIESLSELFRELYSKLIIIKKIDRKNKEHIEIQFKKAKEYLLNNQLEMSIDIVNNMNNPQLKNWILNAKSYQQINLCAQDIFNIMYESLK